VTSVAYLQALVFINPKSDVKISHATIGCESSLLSFECASLSLYITKLWFDKNKQYNSKIKWDNVRACSLSLCCNVLRVHKSIGNIITAHTTCITQSVIILTCSRSFVRTHKQTIEIFIKARSHSFTPRRARSVHVHICGDALMVSSLKQKYNNISGSAL
jgi:hypothetical protein